MAMKSNKQNSDVISDTSRFDFKVMVEMVKILLQFIEQNILDILIQPAYIRRLIRVTNF